MPIKLYYTEKGYGTPLVMLHGNGENGGFFTSVYTAEYATYRKSIVEYETECAWMTGTR